MRMKWNGVSWRFYLFGSKVMGVVALQRPTRMFET